MNSLVVRIQSAKLAKLLHKHERDFSRDSQGITAMKKMIVSLLVLFPLLAVGGEGRGDDTTYVGHMAQRLNLSEEQTQQMREILRGHRQQMRALREATEQKVNALLTEEQRTAMQELRDERQERRKERRDQQHGHEQPAKHGENSQPMPRSAGQSETHTENANGS